MTEREAVNEILLAINELPLEDEDLVSDLPTATICLQELVRAKRKILAQGWFFNSTTINLYPNTEGYIIVPVSYLSVDGSADNASITVRDWKLFDKANLTFVFDEAVECDIIEDIVFDDIPFTIADYIVQFASLQTYIKIIGSSGDINVRQQVLGSAKLEALREDARNIGGNLLDSTHVTTLVTRS